MVFEAQFLCLIICALDKSYPFVVVLLMINCFYVVYWCNQPILIGKKCKSKGSYKRHRTAKHRQDENRVNSDESNTNADKTRKTFILTAVILTKIVPLKVLECQRKRSVFDQD